MKRWFTRLAFVLGLPVASLGLLALGADLRDTMWGRLIQVTGGFLATIWLTGTFLILGAMLSTGSGFRAADSNAPVPTAPPTHRAGETKEESES